MRHISQIVRRDAIADYHTLCGATIKPICNIPGMADSDKNGGANHLRAWRMYRKMSQSELADAVGTNQNMIGYLEDGSRGLSAKWLRRLASALKTQPGLLLDHDPNDLDRDVLETWVNASLREKRQISDIVRVVVSDGTNG